MSLLQSDERLDLLITSLSFAPNAESIARLRISVLSEPGALEGMLTAAARRFLLMASIDGLEANGIIHLRSQKSWRGALRSQLLEIYSHYKRRREEMTGELESMIRMLNDASIEPLILKGAVSLLTGKPAWRHLGDIDFAIEPAQSDATVKALQTLGFRRDPQSRISAHHHHLQPMIKNGFSASVEPHIRLLGKRGARLVDDSKMWSRSIFVESGGLRYRILRDDDFLTYGLVHHHIQNTGSIFGIISMRGLYEFCHALQSLNEPNAGNLLQTLHDNPRLRAAVELWTATAGLLFAFPIPPRIVPGDFAWKRAKAVAERIENGLVASRIRALYEDIAGSYSVDPALSAKRDDRSWVTAPLAESFMKRGLWVRKSKQRKISGIF